MLFLGSSCYECNKSNGEGTLAEMGRDENEVKVEVEEGEISESASVEGISEEDFNRQEVKILKESKSNGDPNSRVWTMRDLYSQYPSIYRGYASGLYNLAWAQAVQNKPLKFAMEVEKDENSKRSSPSASVASPNGKDDKSADTNSNNEAENVVVDDGGHENHAQIVDAEKEEGELEEGEIDMDSEPVEKASVESRGEVSSGDVNVGNMEVDLKKRVSSIRGILEAITANEAGKSFEEVFFRLENALASLLDLVADNGVPTDYNLIKLAFGAINFVFFSVNGCTEERNRSILSRLLSIIKSHDPPLFSSDQMKEIERMLLSLDSSTEASDKEKETKITDGVSREDSYSFCESMSNSCGLVESVCHNKPNMFTANTKPAVSSFRSKGALLPMLDLHKDHDADRLPSPTRETTPSIFVHKSLPIGDGVVKSASVVNNATRGAEDIKLHPYETDALKAVSTYQQKFGRGSMFLNDLPSPTPSEDSGDEGGDTGGEVSSSLMGGFKSNPPVVVQPIVSAPTQVGSTNFGAQAPLVVQNASPLSSGSIPAAKASAKSRDPRLRFGFADGGSFDSSQLPMHNAPKSELVAGLLSSRKQKNVDEPVLDGPVYKKQKNELENSKMGRDVPSISGSGGWMECTDVVGSLIPDRSLTMNNTELHFRKMDNVFSSTSTMNARPNMTVCGSEQVPGTTACTPTSLPALLKDIVVNPTMLINLLKMSQQQKSAAEPQENSADSIKTAGHHPSSTMIRGAVPLVSFASINPSGNLQKPRGTSQIPYQVLPADESGKIRMKPRDPRRVLHGNTIQRNGMLGPKQVKSNGLPTSSTQGSKDNVNTEKPEIQPESKPLQSLPIPHPDIAQQFTKSPKNIVDIVSMSQTSSPLVASANLVSQPVQKEELNAGVMPASELGILLPCSQNAWGDAEHLFDGYDDQQKAAIQRERARRIEEQRKMFASHKLCLVLDLDHTLLNSAKFHEVDPVHEDILRKKEEQDLEKSQRHLFRFPHMGMWTKLRPGIWNFLEKASKLYELHLYTMGNKLYATEMAKVLDPEGVLFAGRVISRGNDGDPFDSDERVPKSKDLEGVLGMESAVVIIDDSVRVWPHNKLNLIVVERYTYFPCSRRQFGLLGPSLLEIDHDERPEDGTLASSLAVIERIHQNFFSNQNLDEVDVRNILASEQRKILAGCRIVFSRVFPVGEANPHLHPLWQTAEQFGAVCTNQMDERVTHVVANSLGTDKVNWALSTGRSVVHRGWLEASALLYRRANELDFAIKP